MEKKLFKINHPAFRDFSMPIVVAEDFEDALRKFKKEYEDDRQVDMDDLESIEIIYKDSEIIF